MTKHSPTRVLIVDDEPAICKSMGNFLEDYGYEISTSVTAAKAYEIMETKPHDIAIVDLNLSAIDGETFILNAHEILPSMRFLIYTGSEEYIIPSELEHIGIHHEHVIYKPIPDLTLIVEAIQNLMQAGEDEHAK